VAWSGVVEPRTRAEYYEALRAADGKPVDDRPVTDELRSDHSGHSGWGAVDAAKRPASGSHPHRSRTHRAVRRMRGGEYGEMTIEVAASLAAHGTARHP
jgi:hypothetical protein